MNNYILYGASGHAKVVIDAMQLNKIGNILLVDDDSRIERLTGYEVVSPTIFKNNSEANVLISLGDNLTRKKIVKKLNVNHYSVIHPKAIIANSVIINKGTFIAAGVIINADSKIGNHSIINTGASIDHDCIIEDFVHIAPSATLCGGISIGEGTLVGAGAVILPNVKIGNWVTVGAGAVVTQDIPDNVSVVGVPAKQINK